MRYTVIKIKSHNKGRWEEVSLCKFDGPAESIEIEIFNFDIDKKYFISYNMKYNVVTVSE